jgi:hypothetical protein
MRALAGPDAGTHYMLIPLSRSSTIRLPLGWATTQNNLGAALTTLGERESGTARLEKAVVAYRDALKEGNSFGLTLT